MGRGACRVRSCCCMVSRRLSRTGGVGGGGRELTDQLAVTAVVLALVTWVALSPLAVLLHRLGKSGLHSMLPWHSRIQKLWTLPATCVAVALGLLASPHSVAHPTLHKVRLGCA